MAKNVTFSLDQKGGQDILTKLVATDIKQRANAIAARARTMASSMTSNPPSFSVETRIGTIKRGTRTIATIRANGDDEHANYIGFIALIKSKDAGR